MASAESADLASLLEWERAARSILTNEGWRWFSDAYLQGFSALWVQVAPTTAEGDRYLVDIFRVALVCGAARDEALGPHEAHQRRLRRERREGLHGYFELDHDLAGEDGTGPASSHELSGLGLREGGYSYARSSRLAGHRMAAAAGIVRATPEGARKYAASRKEELQDQLVADLSALLVDEAGLKYLRQFIAGFETRTGHISGGPQRSPEPYMRLAAIWDESRDSRRPTLTPSRMVRELTLSPKVERVHGEKEDAAGLYSSQNTSGGEAALKVISRSRRVVILSDPGGGKSTVLKAAAAAQVNAGFPALYLPLTVLADTATGPMDITDALEMLVGSALSGAKVSATIPLGQLAGDLEHHPNALIALDGLDELDTAGADLISSLLRALDEFTGTILISSRWTGYATPRGSWHEFCVDDLHPDSADRFLVQWFDGDEDGLDRARQAIVQSDNQHLGKVPVLLGIVAEVARVNEVPRSVAVLYDQYVSLYLEGGWTQRRDVRLSPDDQFRYLQTARKLAWAMATHMTGRADLKRWRDTVTYRQISTAERALGEDHPDLTVVLALAQAHGLIVPHREHPSVMHQEYRWLHRTIHEHLVGAYLATRFDARARDLGLPSDVLMGGSQWLEPLRHLAGLLSPEDQCALIEWIEKHAQERGVGHVHSSLARDIASHLPLGAEARTWLAERRKRERSDFAAHVLDPGYSEGILPEVLKQGESGRIIRTVSFLSDPPEGLSESYARELVQCQRAAPSVESGTVCQTSCWLSRFDPDEALRFLIEADVCEEELLSADGWAGRPPSLEAVAGMAETIAARPPGCRLSILIFLSGIGVKLDSLVQPYGPFEQIDIDAAASVAIRHHSGEEESESLREARRRILEGAYGDVRAFDLSLELGERAFAYSLRSPAAEIGALVSLYRTQAQLPESTGDLTSAMEVIRGLSAYTLPGTDLLLEGIRAAAILQVNASALSPGQCFEVCWAVARCFHQVYQAFPPTHLALSALDTIQHLTFNWLDTRAGELLPEVTQTDPRDWVVGLPSHADFEVLMRLHEERPLPAATIAGLVVWAARSEIQLLRSFRLGKEAPAIVEMVWQEFPDALAVNDFQFATQLAEAGVFGAWRDRIVQASKAHSSRSRPPAITSSETNPDTT